MSSHGTYGSSMLFQTITDDLNMSLANADELSREFNSLLKEVSSSTEGSSAPTSRAKPQAPTSTSTSSSSSSSSSTVAVSGVSSSNRDGSLSNRGTMSLPQPSVTTAATTAAFQPSIRSAESVFPRNTPALSSPQSYQYTATQSHKTRQDSGYSHGQLSTPNQSPRTQRRASPTPMRSHERNLSGSFNYAELITPPGRPSSPSMLHPANSLMTPHEASSSGSRSPRMDRVPSPSPLSQPATNTLPRNFLPFKPSDEGLQKQRSPVKWNETDLDVSYTRKPHNTYDQKEWIRPLAASNNWRESNLDSPTTPRKEPLTRQLQPINSSLPRTTRISVPPDRASPTPSLYAPQPIISRISIPPSSPSQRQHRPIPLSVIMRLQNPYYTGATHYPSNTELNPAMYRQPIPLPREYLYQFQPPPPELRPPAYYAEVLTPGDVDAEVERLNTVKPPAVQVGPVPISEQVGPVPSPDQGKEAKVEGSAEDTDSAPAPRPLSPTRLQPVVAPEAPVVPNLEEILRIRAEIPRALKRRGSVDQSRGLKKLVINQSSQYQQMINKLFRRKGRPLKGEVGSESSSSDSEESITGFSLKPPPTVSNIASSAQQKGLRSILRKASKGGKNSRARLSPLVLLLDGALVGELETVQKAVQEMSDPGQPNDEGITALHNAICGGHYAVVEFLVQMGANVSAPDSHGWTPLHCAASCNDRALCEYLVRNGAAVMAVTESDGATAAQKCDPYAVGYEECESFLRGVEEMMGVENSGVLYALWSYPAQAPDELSFREGDMVTILQKPEGVDWWWASLCGREGFVPNNYFGLFPKVRPKSLC